MASYNVQGAKEEIKRAINNQLQESMLEMRRILSDMEGMDEEIAQGARDLLAKIEEELEL